MPDVKIKEVLKRHADELMAAPGVVGIAEGKSHGKPCIKVFVTAKADKVLTKMPRTIEGFPIHIEESGEFRALNI